MRLSFAVFLGALIALGGVSIILNALFKIDLPIFRIALGVFFLYLGVVVLFGRSAPARPGDWSGDAPQSHYVPHSVSGQALKYDVVFGRGIVDLTQLQPSDQPRKLEINVIFGEAKVMLDPAIPYEVEASSVFGSSRMPDRQRTSFGSLRYAPKDQQEAALLRIKLNVVFGTVEVQEARSVSSRLRAPAEPALHEELPAPH